MADPGTAAWSPFRCTLLSILAVVFLALCPLRAQGAGQVLVLNSYHPGYKWSDDILHALETSLHQFDPELVIRVEHLDTKRNLDQTYIDSLPDCLKRKYAFMRPDLVVAVDEAAFKLMLGRGEEMFGSVPTVFCGVNASPLPAVPPWMTGVREHADLAATIRLMRSLKPNLREVAVIVDRTDTGQAILADLRTVFPADLSLRVLDDLPLPQLAREVSGLRPETGLLFLLYSSDRNGNVYEPAEAMGVVSKASPTPVFGAWNFLMGHGLLGGYLTSGYAQGRIAGNLAARILSGEGPSRIPVVVDDVVALEVDVREMARFGLSTIQFPEETRFFNVGQGTRRDILVLHSYNAGFRWTDDILRGITESLANFPGGTELHVEYMDTKRHPEAEFTYLTYLLLREKYRFTKFSAVLTSDDNAFNFARQYRKALFPGAPIVFCGVNYLENPPAMAAENITGVLESYDIVDTVKAATDLVPGARHLVVINDATPTGLGNLKRFEEVRPLLPERLRVEMLQNMSMTRLLERLASLPPDAIILLMSMNRDKDGNTFTYDESCAKIVGASPVPVFSFWDFYLGAGTVGGVVTSGYHQGLSAGSLARQILSGKSARDLPVIVESPKSLIFDAGVMRRFGLNRRLLPQDAVLINDDAESARYTRAVWTIAILMAIIVLLLMAFLGFYGWQRRKRRHLERTVRIDPLTGAFTRAAFESEMPRTIASSTERGERFMLCFVDVDKLKHVNDTHGHLHGDTYLKEVVAVLRSSIRSSDEIFRVGGDEFVVVFPGCGEAEAKRIWNQIDERIVAINLEGRLPFTMGITHGCVGFDPESPQDMATLLRLADLSMYGRKSAAPENP
ncbi:diguanylate cyclase domain-containing protein [Desulfomicrobium salsuginis]